MSHPDDTFPHAGPRVSVEDPAAGDPAPLAAGSGISTGVVAVAGVLALALGWSLLALRSPTTTYHLAPLLITVAPIWIIGRRGETRGKRTVRYVILGAVIATFTTVALSVSGSMQGPTLTGSHAAAGEAMIVTGLGAALVSTGAWSRKPTR